MTDMRQGAVAAATLAIAALFVAGPAAAAAKPSGNYYAPAHPHSCWQYSSRSEHWVDVCRTYPTATSIRGMNRYTRATESFPIRIGSSLRSIVTVRTQDMNRTTATNQH
jgi:hypothetical protein